MAGLIAIGTGLFLNELPLPNLCASNLMCFSRLQVPKKVLPHFIFLQVSSPLCFLCVFSCCTDLKFNLHLLHEIPDLTSSGLCTFMCFVSSHLFKAINNFPLVL